MLVMIRNLYGDIRRYLFQYIDVALFDAPVFTPRSLFVNNHFINNIQQVTTMPPKATALQMQMYDDRLASFEPITKPKTKARPGWPLDAKTHPLLTPANMASAGFYFSPGSNEDSGDNCACFLCGVQLGGWAEDDDPHKEHVDRGNCAWAETVCQVVLDKVNNV
jgi:hypothetical protein